MAAVEQLVPDEDSWEAETRQVLAARYGVVRPFVELLAEVLPLKTAPVGAALLREISPMDETYRRTVTRQLNILESRHPLARKILHGHRGEIYQAYRSGQEDPLGALGLVLNAVVLGTPATSTLWWAALRAAVRDEDAARLSLLGYAHINTLGHYTFTHRRPTVAYVKCAPQTVTANRSPWPGVGIAAGRRSLAG